jgi:hypothetical protein
MFLSAEKLHATEALQISLIDAIATDPVAEAVRLLLDSASSPNH